MPGCVPTAYGLGKSGWVSMTFTDAEVPVAMLQAWIDESYRAQAPRKLVATLDGGTAPAARATPKAKTTAKSTARSPKAKATKPPKAAPKRAR